MSFRAPRKARRIRHLLPKLLGTTVVASIVFAALYAIIVHQLITLDDIPFLPRYEAIR